MNVNELRYTFGGKVKRCVCIFLLYLFLFLPSLIYAANTVTINERMNIQISVAMSKTAGDNQQGEINTALSQPFVVKVSYLNENGVSGVPINFAITSQPQGATGARLSATIGITDANGEAQVTLTLGNLTGQYQVQASNSGVTSGSPITFTATAKDTTPPAQITNLVATEPTPNSIKRTWTAPGDDGNSGTATEYDIRYSTAIITEANWASATTCSNEPSPRVAGTLQSFVVSSLSSATQYWFAIKTRDEVPNWSALSNVPTTATIDTTPPSAITDLGVSNIQSTSVTLNWTAPGDNGNSGTATEYDIRYSTAIITEANWVSATTCSNEPSPRVAGTLQSFVVSSLSPGTQYWFAIKTRDEVPNWSALSNVPSAKTLDAPPMIMGTIPDPLTWTTGEIGAIYSWVIDEEGIEKVVLSYIPIGSTGYTTTNMLFMGGDQYGTSSIPAGNNAGTIYYHVTAYDTGGNITVDPLSGDYQVQVVDNDPPAGIIDLQVSTTQSTSVTLNWTAPGDDGNTGRATSYDIRYSTIPLSESNWQGAIQVPNEPRPKLTGSLETFVVSGLHMDTLYYFGIKTLDEVLNISPLSNIAQGRTSPIPISIEKVIITHTPFNVASSPPQTLNITSIVKCRVANTGNPQQDFRYFTPGPSTTYPIWDGRTYYADNDGVRYHEHETSYWIEMLNATRITTYQWDVRWGTLTHNWTQVRGPYMNTNGWGWQNSVRFTGTGTYAFRDTVTWSRSGQVIQTISSHGDTNKSRPATIPTGEVENIQDIYMVHLKGGINDAYGCAESFLTVPYTMASPYPVDYHGIDCAGLIHAGNWLNGNRIYKASAHSYLTSTNYSSPLGAMNPRVSVGAQRNDWMGVDRKTSNKGFDGIWNHIVLIKSYHGYNSKTRNHDMWFIEAQGSENRVLENNQYETYPMTQYNLIFRRPR